MPRTRIPALLAAGALGLALPVACGSSDRNSVQRGNPGSDVPVATPATTQSNPTELAPTGPQEPTVTQAPQTTATGPSGGAQAP